jgi:hypothetical protein
MTGVGSALLAWLTGGSTLGALAKVLLAVCGLVVGLVYRRYLGILGRRIGGGRPNGKHTTHFGTVSPWATWPRISMPSGSPGSSTW